VVVNNNWEELERQLEEVAAEKEALLNERNYIKKKMDSLAQENVKLNKTVKNLQEEMAKVEQIGVNQTGSAKSDRLSEIFSLSQKDARKNNNHSFDF